MTNQPEPKILTEHTDTKSTNRVLLKLILIVLCTIGIVIITKNIALLWVCRRRLPFMGERHVTSTKKMKDSNRCKQPIKIFCKMLNELDMYVCNVL